MVCNVKSISSQELDNIRQANLSKVYNFSKQVPIEETPEPEIQVSTTKNVRLKELDQLIIGILESTKGGPSSPAFVHAIIKNKGYEYTGKQVCNKMWALERKGLIRKEQSGAYSAIQRETAVESDTQA